MPNFRTITTLTLAAVFFVPSLFAPSLFAQESSSSLPDAPSAFVADSDQAPAPTVKMAGPYDKYIEPGQPVPKLDFHDKFVLGIKDSVSIFSAIGWVASAGYEQVTTGSPNFPQTGKGFAQRLGAAAARDSSEEIFTSSILAPILHEDPRYYRLGPGHNFFARFVYAGTRPIFIRTDGGHQTVNFARLGGAAGAAGLTNVYYPQLNRGFTQTAETFGGSLGGDAVGFLVSEFSEDVLHVFHKKNP